MYQNIPTKVLTGEVRLSYVNVITPRESQTVGGKPKYSAALLIPKSDAVTKADIDQSIQAAAQEALTKLWGGVQPPVVNIPIYDGDGVRPKSGAPFGDECKGHWVLNTSSVRKPQVVGQDNINVELAPSDIYSGMYARVIINFFGYDNNGKGVGAGLGNIMKTRDGEAFAGGSSASSDFANVGNAVVQTQTNPFGAPFSV